MSGDRGEQSLSGALSYGRPGIQAEILELVVQTHPQLVKRGHVLAPGKLREDFAALLTLRLQGGHILEEEIAQIPEEPHRCE